MTGEEENQPQLHTLRDIFQDALQSPPINEIRFLRALKPKGREPLSAQCLISAYCLVVFYGPHCTTRYRTCMFVCVNMVELQSITGDSVCIIGRRADGGAVSPTLRLHTMN